MAWAKVSPRSAYWILVPSHTCTLWSADPLSNGVCTPDHHLSCLRMKPNKVVWCPRLILDQVFEPPMTHGWSVIPPMPWWWVFSMTLNYAISWLHLSVTPRQCEGSERASLHSIARCICLTGDIVPCCRMRPCKGKPIVIGLSLPKPDGSRTRMSRCQCVDVPVEVLWIFWWPHLRLISQEDHLEACQPHCSNAVMVEPHY